MHGKKKDHKYNAAYEQIYKPKLHEKGAAATSKWSTSVSYAAPRIWKLHCVLEGRNDLLTRRQFLEVVSESALPKEVGSGLI